MKHQPFAAFGKTVILELSSIAAATALFASTLIAEISGPKRNFAASSGMVATDVGSDAFDLRTAVTAIKVDANAAAIEGIKIKYFSTFLTSESDTSDTPFP
jgi:hypothetical protein